MTIHVSLWMVAALTLVALYFVASRVGRERGQFDFVSPLYGVAIMVGGVLFWVGLFLGRWFR